MRGLFVLLALLGGCSSATKGLGNNPLDQAALANTKDLAYLGEAGPTKVLDLFDSSLSFRSAPDPTKLFDATYSANQALDLGNDTVSLKLLAYNTGLLDRRYLFGLQRVAVPHIDQRRAALPGALLAGHYDILFLEEVWELSDVAAIKKVLEPAGYTIYAGSDQIHQQTGVVIAVRKSLVDGAFRVTEEGQYDAQRKLEYWPGPNLRRGWIHVSFHLAGTSRTVDLFCTHLTPFANKWVTRNLQVRQLGLKIRTVPSDHIVLLGGDLNASTYYAANTWTNGKGKVTDHWWDNATMVPLLLYYGGLQDAHVATAPSVAKERGDSVPLHGSLTVPYGDASFCKNLPHDTFTSTDCNSLYFSEYAGMQFPQRLDYLLYRGDGEVKVTDAHLAFVQPMTFPDGTYELSDHYGSTVDIEVAK